MKWSISSHNTFRRCQRQYFFQNIMASHNARDPLRWEAHILRQLKSLSTWRGSVVHDSLSNFFVPSLQSSGVIDEKELVGKTLQIADQQYAFSMEKRYRSNVPKSKLGLEFCALFEHEYGKKIESQDLYSTRAEMAQCLKNLYENKDFINLIRYGTWYGNELNLPFKIGEDSISAKLDVVFFTKDNKVKIIDWKIGNSATSDYSSQLMVYALAVASKWKKNPDEIEVYEANLLKGQIVRYPVTDKKLQIMEDFIFKSLSEIKALTMDNGYAIQNFEEFDIARRSTTCAFCKFRKLCLVI